VVALAARHFTAQGSWYRMPQHLHHRLCWLVVKLTHPPTCAPDSVSSCKSCADGGVPMWKDSLTFNASTVIWRHGTLDRVS
jgi:hypothetical protein